MFLLSLYCVPLQQLKIFRTTIQWRRGDFEFCERKAATIFFLYFPSTDFQKGTFEFSPKCFQMQFELIQTQKTARNKRQTSFVPLFRAEIARAFPGFSSRINIHGGPHAGWISGQFCVPPTDRRSASLPFLVYALRSGFREKDLSETRIPNVFSFSVKVVTCLSYS